MHMSQTTSSNSFPSCSASCSLVRCSVIGFIFACWRRLRLFAESAPRIISSADNLAKIMCVHVLRIWRSSNMRCAVRIYSSRTRPETNATAHTWRSSHTRQMWVRRHLLQPQSRLRARTRFRQSSANLHITRTARHTHRARIIQMGPGNATFLRSPARMSLHTMMTMGVMHDSVSACAHKLRTQWLSASN